MISTTISGGTRREGATISPGASVVVTGLSTSIERSLTCEVVDSS